MRENKNKMSLKVWKFSPQLVSPALVKQYFLLFRKSLFNEVRYAVIIISFEASSFNHPNTGPFLLNPEFKFETPGIQREYHLTHPEQICIKLNGESVHNFFIFLDDKFNSINKLDNNLLNTQNFHKILFRYIIINKEIYEQARNESRMIYHF